MKNPLVSQKDSKILNNIYLKYLNKKIYMAAVLHYCYKLMYQFDHSYTLLYGGHFYQSRGVIQTFSYVAYHSDITGYK